MARYLGYKKPKDLKRTMRHLMHYLGGHKWMFLLVALLVLISTGANILGTYLLKPVINRFILPGDVKGLLTAVVGMGILYLCGGGDFWLQSAYGNDGTESDQGDSPRFVCPCTKAAP